MQILQGNGTMLDTVINVTDGNGINWANVAYAVIAINAGDTLVVDWHGEYRNDTPANIEFVTQLVLGPSWFPNNQDSGVGFYQMIPLTGSDVGPAGQQHYYSVPRTVHWTVPLAMAAGCLQARVRCRTDDPTGIGGTCAIMTNQQMLRWTIFRP